MVLSIMFLRFVFLSIVFSLLFSCYYFTKSKQKIFAPKVTKPLVGHIIRDLPFFPINNDRFRLSELKDVKAVVVAIRSRATKGSKWEASCALGSKRAGFLLSRLEKKYSSSGVKFIYSYYSPLGFDLQDEERRKALQEAEEDLQSFAFQGDYIVDSKQKLLSALGARRDGEVFVLDGQRRLVYKGFLTLHKDFNPEKGLSAKASEELEGLEGGLRAERKGLENLKELKGSKKSVKGLKESRVYLADQAHPVLSKESKGLKEGQGDSAHKAEEKLPLELVLDSLIKGEKVTFRTGKGTGKGTRGDESQKLLRGEGEKTQLTKQTDKLGSQSEIQKALKGRGLKLCLIPRPRIEQKVFFEDVAKIINNKCSICHHPEGTGPMDFITYQDVAGRGKMFQYVIEQDLMPPWSVDPNTGPFKNDLSLGVKDRALLLKWAEGGFLRKDDSKDQLKELYLKHLKEQPEEKFDWTIRLPETVKIPKGFKPNMFSDYKNFIIKTNFKEDKWIKKIKMVPQPKNVHHIDLFIMKPNLNDTYITSILNNFNEIFKNSINYYGVGSNSWYINEYNSEFSSSGSLLPKGSTVLMFIHYESLDQNILDDWTHIKFLFHKKPPKYKTVLIILNKLKIALFPYDPIYKSQFTWKLKDDVWLINTVPHMHLRGKAASLYIQSPQGERKKLFSIDPYLTKFDRIYELKKPIFLKKGTILECVNYFDNSMNNPENPDPSKFVSFGPGRYDEMSQCYFKFLGPMDSKVKTQYINL